VKAWNKKGVLSVGMAILIILCIDGILFMGQYAIYDIGAEMGIEAETVFFHYPDSFLSKFAHNGTITTNSSIDDLLGTDSEVNPETGDVFTDTFAKVKSWFTGIGAGMAIFFEALAGPYRYFVMLGMPWWFNLSFGAIWYGITILLFVAFIAGRSAD
jgi:hypothetical protein